MTFCFTRSIELLFCYRRVNVKVGLMLLTNFMNFGKVSEAYTSCYLMKASI